MFPVRVAFNYILYSYLAIHASVESGLKSGCLKVGRQKRRRASVFSQSQPSTKYNNRRPRAKNATRPKSPRLKGDHSNRASNRNESLIDGTHAMTGSVQKTAID